MAAITTPQRSTASSPVQSKSSPVSSISSSSSCGDSNNFRIELDKTLSSSLWIELMEWSQNMDVIALIMHQTSNDAQHLWLQRCVGKWQNLLNIDLSQELDDPNIRILSISWRYDGNGVCLGLSNGEIIQFLIENDNDNNNKIIKSKIHNKSINNIEWIMDKNDNDNDDDEENNDNDMNMNEDNINSSNYDNFDNLFGSENNIKDINSIMQNNEDLLSCTQLNPNQYENCTKNTILTDNNHNLLSSLTFNDETNKFLSKIPSLPKPPRIDFRYKIDAKRNTLQYMMKKQNIPPIPRKSQPNSLPLLITSDCNQIQLHSSGIFCIGKVNMNLIKPSKKMLAGINDENEIKTNIENIEWSIKYINLCNNLQCINTIISNNKTNDKWLRFIHSPILHSRRNELLIITNHGDYIETLLNHLNKLDRHLMSRWAMGCRSIKNKINPLIENIESYNISSSWQHEFKHNLLIGSPSPAFLQYVEQNLNVTALERGYKQFDQFINEMLEIIQKNLNHIICELIFRCSELKGYSLWMERFGSLGLNEKKISIFIDKLSALYIKLDQLQILIADSKLNLIAFKNYLVFLSSLHNSEESEFVESFDKLDCKRIFAAIDYDLDPGRISLFLRNALLPKGDLILFSLQNNNNNNNNDKMIEPILSKIKKKWKRFQRFSFSYLVQDVRRSWKPILSVLSPNISRSFMVENNDYGLLYLSNGENKEKNKQYIYHPIDINKDISFVTTNIFMDVFGIECDVNLCCLSAKRTLLKTDEKQSKLVFIAIIPEINNNRSKFVLSNDIWTDDFDEFENIISEFPAHASINDVKICVVDINPFVDDEEETGAETEALNFDSIDIVEIKFINSYRLGILAKLRYSNNINPQTCLLTMNLRKIDFEFQENLRLNDYEMSLNELAFDILPNEININNINKYIFGGDVDGDRLCVCGSRKLAAISCDPCIDNNNKCNRLIVLDINIDDEDEESDDESDDDDEDNKSDKNEMSGNESYSYENEDSDLRKIIDID